MRNNPREKHAIDAYWKAPEAIRPFILEQALLRVQTTLALSAAQQQRLTQAATLLFAAAALSAQATFAMEGPPRAAHWFIVGASAFSFGAVASSWGLATGRIQRPGYDPSWWAGAPTDSLTIEGAKAWQAHNLEEVLFTMRHVMRRRGAALNASLACAAAGVLALLCGAFTQQLVS